MLSKYIHVIIYLICWFTLIFCWPLILSSPLIYFLDDLHIVCIVYNFRYVPIFIEYWENFDFNSSINVRFLLGKQISFEAIFFKEYILGKNCPWHHKNLLGNNCVVRFPSTSVSTMLLNCRVVKIRRILNFKI